MKRFKKIISHILVFTLLVCALAVQEGNSINAQAAGGKLQKRMPVGDLESKDTQDWFKDMVNSFKEDTVYWANTGMDFAGNAISTLVNGSYDVVNTTLDSIFGKQINFYDQPNKVYNKNTGSYLGDPSSSSTSTPNSYYYYQGATTSTTNKNTNNYNIYQDNSDYSTHTYNYNWYNPITKTYNTTNNYQYSYDYNTYYYQETTENYQYDYYYIDNSTHATYYIIQTETNAENTPEVKEYIYDVYYELPDGRNSYTLTADDVWGQYFLYNTSKYDIVPEDDGTTLGLWHFDGNLEDSSYWNNKTGSSKNLQYSDGVFDSGKYVGDEITLNVNNCPFDSKSSFTLEWWEFFPTVQPSYTLPRTDKTEIHHYYNYICLNSTRYCPEGWRIGEFAHYALVFDGTNYNFFENGIKLSVSNRSGDLGSGNNSYPAAFWFYNNKSIDIRNEGNSLSVDYPSSNTVSWKYSMGHKGAIIDEMRLSKGVLYTLNFVPPVQPFDTNEVLVIPDDAADGSVLFYTRYDYNDYRIGGVRPTYPTDGYIYVAVEDDTVQSVQQYQVNHWEEIDAFLYNSGQVTDLKGYNLSGNKVTEPEEPKPDNGNSPGTGSGNNPGDNKDPSGDDGDFDFWGAVGDLLGGVIDFFGTILGLLGKLVGLFSDIVSGLFSFLEVFTGFGGGFTDFLVAVFPFIPAEVWKLIGAGISAMILVGIIKLIRG